MLCVAVRLSCDKCLQTWRKSSVHDDKKYGGSMCCAKVAITCMYKLTIFQFVVPHVTTWDWSLCPLDSTNG